MREIRLLFIPVIFVIQISFSQIQVSQFSAYQKNILGKYAGQENVSADNGGYYTLLLYNAGSIAENISGIRFVSNAVTYNPTAWYGTTAVINPSTYATFFVKGTGMPFRDNDTATIEIITDQSTYSSGIKNKTPLLRFSAIIPDTAAQELLIYLRNTDTLDYTLDTLMVDGVFWDAALVNKIVGQNRIIKSKETTIIKIPYDTYAFLKNIHCGIAYHSGAGVIYNAASLRLMPPQFIWGTWYSSAFNPDKENSRKDFRNLRITSVHGPGNTNYMQYASDDYFLQTIMEANFSLNDTFQTGPAITQIQNLQDRSYIHAWTIDDEPDLNGKDIGEQVIKANTYRKHDLNTPVHVNLSVEKKFCRYGWYSDIVSMDHYAAPPAPNIISLRWVPIVGQPGELYEALDYTEALKWNAEPRRIWSWVQFAPGPWDYAEDDFALNIQFWMHIFGGAKSIEYFVAQSHTKDDHPRLWQEAERLVKQFSGIEHLVGFAEPSGLVKSNTIKCTARALVSDKYMLIAAMNNTVSYTWNGNLANIRYNANIQYAPYQLDITVPEWITSPTAWMILPDGRKKNIAMQSLGNNKYRIISPENLYKQSHIFLIGPADTQLPGTPTKLQAVDVGDNKNYTLSWNFGADNLGVAGYILNLNGQLKDTVYGQVYEVDSLELNCPYANWSLKTFDFFRNISADSLMLIVPYDLSIESANLVSYSRDSFYEVDETVILEASVRGNAISQQWQVSADSLNWTNYVADTTTLLISLDSLVYRTKITGTKYLRKKVADGCGNIFYTPVMKVVTRPQVSTNSGLNMNQVALIFPNPAKGKFSVQFSALFKVFMLEVFNEINQRVFNLSNPGNIVQVDLSSQSPGLYYVVAHTETTKSVYKLVIVK